MMKWACLLLSSIAVFAGSSEDYLAFEDLSFERPLPLLEETEDSYSSFLVAEAPLPLTFDLKDPVTPSLSMTEISTPISQTASSEWLKFSINFQQVFNGAPLIYSLMLGLSIATFSIWLYSLMKMKQSFSLNPSVMKSLHHHLHSSRYEEAAVLCEEHNLFLCGMLGAAIKARSQSSWTMLEFMRAEGKRRSLPFWQRLGLLNDIAVIAPMLGLLGTVLGMFYAFYDMDRSMTSLTHLFDGLGVSVGTTLVGLCVAIVALSLHAVAKYRLVSALSYVESQAEGLVRYLPSSETRI